MNYVQLCDEEYRVLQMLDGKTSLQQIQQRLERESFPARIAVADIEQLLVRLLRENLLVVEAFGQAQPLLDRRAERRRRLAWSWMGNLLAIRLPGVNPAPLLERVYPRVRWAFSRGSMFCGLLLIGAALLVAILHLDALRAEFPAFAEFVAPRNLLALALAVIAAKCVHELAHALTCKHFGGTCHELGVMLLAFTPCLYCNVSDAWTFPNKWHRVAVSLAGIAAELVLAAAGTIVWWWSEPGLLHWVCLYVVLVCCVSSILINGNPLLKYDGYYALSDWVDVPNLRQQAGQAVEQAIARLLWGVVLYSPRTLPGDGRWLLVLYWLAAAAFRCAVTVAVLWGGYQMAKRFHLETVACLLVATVLAGAGVAVSGVARRMAKRARARRGNSLRALVIGGGLLALAAGALLAPWPNHVTAPVVLWPADTQNIYVVAPGNLATFVPVGTRVARGQVIAQFENLEMARELERLAGRSSWQRLHVRNLELRRTRDPEAGNELPSAREMLVDLETQFKDRQRDFSRLTVVSPADGIVLPPLHATRDPDLPGEITTCRGDAFEDHNRGVFVDTGTLLCHVGDPQRMEALLLVDDAARRQIALGQTVRIRPAASGSRRLTGKIAEIAQTDLQDSKRTQLFGVTPLSGLVDRSPLAQAAYSVRVALEEADCSPLCGVTGEAKIVTGPRSLLRRWLDYLNETFRFRL